MKPPGPPKTLISELSRTRDAIFHFFAEAVFHPILGSFWMSFSTQNAIKKSSEKHFKKSLEIESKKASKRNPKRLPKHLENLSKNKPEKTWKKEGLRVIRGRRPSCNRPPSPSKPPPRLEEEAGQNVQRGRGASRHLSKNEPEKKWKKEVPR